MNSLRTVILRLSRSSSVHLLKKDKPSLSKIDKRFSSSHSNHNHQSEFSKSGLVYTLMGSALTGTILAVHFASDNKKKENRPVPIRPVQIIQPVESEVIEEEETVVVEEEIISSAEAIQDSTQSETTKVEELVNEVVSEATTVQSIEESSESVAESVAESVPSIEVASETLNVQPNQVQTSEPVAESALSIEVPVAESEVSSVSPSLSDQISENSESNESENSFVIIPTFDENEERED